ncbi:hypothetical protein ACPWIP_004229 [Escherichia coli]
MKITEELIYKTFSNTFEGTMILLKVSILSTLITLFILINGADPGAIESIKVVFVTLALYAMSVGIGLGAMLLSPITYKVADCFELKANSLLCKVISIVYGMVYFATTYVIATYLTYLITDSYRTGKELVAVYVISTATISFIQARRLYKLIGQ